MLTEAGSEAVLIGLLPLNDGKLGVAGAAVDAGADVVDGGSEGRAVAVSRSVIGEVAVARGASSAVGAEAVSNRSL